MFIYPLEILIVNSLHHSKHFGGKYTLNNLSDRKRELAFTRNLFYLLKVSFFDFFRYLPRGGVNKK